MTDDLELKVVRLHPASRGYRARFTHRQPGVDPSYHFGEASTATRATLAALCHLIVAKHGVEKTSALLRAWADDPTDLTGR